MIVMASSSAQEETRFPVNSKDESTNSESSLVSTPKKSTRDLTVKDIESGFDFETAEEYLLFHSRVGNLSVVEKLIEFKKAGEIELDINCKGVYNTHCFSSSASLFRLCVLLIIK